MKSDLGRSHVVLTTPKTSLEKLTVTVVDVLQLADIEKTDPKEDVCCPKWTFYNGSRKVCIHFKTDLDKLYIVVYRYRKKFHLKGNEIDLKLTEYQRRLTKLVYLLSYVDVLFRRCIVLGEATVHNSKFWSRMVVLFQ